MERAPPGRVRPMACEGKADSLTSTIKLSNAFSPVLHDRDSLSEVTLETTSPYKSGGLAMEERKGGVYFPPDYPLMSLLC